MTVPSPTPPSPTAAAIDALAPTGSLRAGINLSNFLLVSGTDRHGAPVGVSPDMAAAIAAALGVDVDLVTYPSPGALADAVSSDAWDIGNIGAEPQRAEHIAFSPPYCEIDATLLVPSSSSASSLDDLDRPGVRIAVKARAAYCLWLERHLRHATLVPVESHDAATAAFAAGLDALASLRPRLLEDARATPGSRVLEGRFMAVQQAVGTPRSRNEAGAEFLAAFVGFAITSGLVATFIERHGVVGQLSPAAAPAR